MLSVAAVHDRVKPESVILLDYKFVGAFGASVSNGYPLTVTSSKYHP